MRATIFLAEEMKGRYSIERFKMTKSTFSTRWSNRYSLVGAAASAYKQAKKAESSMKNVDKEVKQKEKDGATKEEIEKTKVEAMAKAAKILETETLPAILGLAWSICARDLEVTIKSVVQYFLKDGSVPWVIRIRRAQSLLMVGQTFIAASASASKTEVGTSLLENVMIGMMMKKDSQEQ